MDLIPDVAHIRARLPTGSMDKIKPGLAFCEAWLNFIFLSVLSVLSFSFSIYSSRS